MPEETPTLTESEIKKLVAVELHRWLNYFKFANTISIIGSFVVMAFSFLNLKWPLVAVVFIMVMVGAYYTTQVATKIKYLEEKYNIPTLNILKR